MKVYIVLEGSTVDGDYVKGVFDTREKAQTDIDRNYDEWQVEPDGSRHHGTSYVNIEEFEVH